MVNTILLRPLPFRSPNQLVWFAANGGKGGLSDQTYTVAAFEEFQRHNRSFQDVTSYQTFFNSIQYKLTGRGEPQPVVGIQVAENFFPMLGIQPSLGRLFTPDECRKGGRAAALLSYPFWQRQFGGDPAIVGRTITINAAPADITGPVTVIGVLPASFDFGSVFSPGMQVDFYVPAYMDFWRTWGNTVAVLGRLKPGVSLGQAQAEADLLFPQLKAAHKDWFSDYKSALSSLQERVSGKLRRSLVVLWCAVGMILLIVCINVSNLMLARAVSRGKEFALRSALGAGRGRLVRQLLTESLTLSGAGAIARPGLRLGSHLLSRAPEPDAAAAALHRPGGWRGARLDGPHRDLGRRGLRPRPRLQAFRRQRAGGAERWRPGHEPGQKARTPAIHAGGLRSGAWRACCWSAPVCCCAAFCASSTSTSASSLLTSPPSRSNSTMAEIWRAALRSSSEILQRVRAIPGIEAAGMTDMLPLDRNRSWGFVAKENVNDRSIRHGAFVYVVSPGYLEAMGMRLRRGRDISWQDRSDTQHAIVINEAAARREWPGQDPIGRTAYGPGRGEARVVGVISDVRESSLEDQASAQMYIPITQFDPEGTELVVRTRLPISAVEPAVMSTLRSLNPGQPRTQFRTLQLIVDHAVSPRRFLMVLVSTFAGFGLILAALGIYGVISYSVTRQSQEIGIRMALGATASQVQFGVVGQTLRLALIGIAIGSAASFAVAHSNRLAALRHRAHRPGHLHRHDRPARHRGSASRSHPRPPSLPHRPNERPARRMTYRWGGLQPAIRAKPGRFPVTVLRGA